MIVEVEIMKNKIHDRAVVTIFKTEVLNPRYLQLNLIEIQIL